GSGTCTIGPRKPGQSRSRSRAPSSSTLRSRQTRNGSRFMAKRRRKASGARRSGDGRDQVIGQDPASGGFGYLFAGERSDHLRVALQVVQPEVVQLDLAHHGGGAFICFELAWQAA